MDDGFYYSQNARITISEITERMMDRIPRRMPKMAVPGFLPVRAERLKQPMIRAGIPMRAPTPKQGEMKTPISPRISDATPSFLPPSEAGAGETQTLCGIGGTV